MKHYLITKINVETEFWPNHAKKMSSSRFDEDYLSQRLDLFERYTVASVEAQTCKDFTWLVFIHPDTDITLKKEFGDRAGGLIEVTSDTEIHNFVGGDETDTITTNLDSDDLIAVDYIDSIQEEYRSGLCGLDRPVVLSFPGGYVLSDQRREIIPITFKPNQFTSLVESGSNPSTISSYRHLGSNALSSLTQQFPIVVSKTGRMWIIVAHGQNIANRFKKLARASAVLNVNDIYSDNVRDKLRPYYQDLRRFKLG
jgi:hypothetical protein